MRDMMRPQIRKKITGRDKCCQICGYSLEAALRVHHIAPVSLGGMDHDNNLTTLCSNCHALVHYYSAKRFEGKNIKELVAPELTKKTAQDKLLILIEQIRRAKKSDVPQYDLDQAIHIVSKKNKLLAEDAELMSTAVYRVIQHIPGELRERCSYRLIRNGKCISITAMNYLLFRVPGLADMRDDYRCDCFIIFPSDTSPLHFIEEPENQIGFVFKDFNCINLALDIEQLLAFDEHNCWSYFADACRAAVNAKKSRDWTSNIKII